MPNWCECDLTISDNEPLLIALDEKLKKNEYKIFETLLPIPEELKETQSPNHLPKALTGGIKKRHGVDNWYDWQLINWGCKWGDCNTEQYGFSKNKKKLYFQFETPWGPPIPGIFNLSKLMPSTEFKLKYSEPGMGFSGSITFKDSKILKENHKN